ncbi:protein of unknown function [Shinella sp. WSC3-e]|nr:protein of unknown function [Shinella sp. WSC3-e]
MDSTQDLKTMRYLFEKTILASVGSLLIAGAALAGGPDLILHNAVIVTMDTDKPRASALAIAGERITAIGDDEAITSLKTDRTRVIDLKGKTVIPGLVDTHSHAIRGGQTFTFETYWYGETNLSDALQALQDAARDRAETEWVAVVGSWLPEQFAEKRPPTFAELTQAVPDRPAYIQYLYDYALVNAKGVEALRLDDAEPAVSAGITIERGPDGKATGKLLGTIASYNALFAQIAPQEEARRKESLQAFFTALNSGGMTGFIDPSAGPASSYDRLFALHREGKLTIRAGYRIPAMKSGVEAQWFRDVMAFRQPDARLR